MSLIEEAAKRLEQLRRAGVEISAPGAVSGEPAAEHAAERVPTPEKLMQAMAPAGAEVANPTAGSPAQEPVAPPAAPEPVNAAARPRVPEPPPTHLPGTPDGDRRSRVVHIDLDALGQAGYLTPSTQRSQLAYEFRVLKRPIIKNASGRGPTQIANANRVMVTSALPGEGKTFVALNLALSMALEVDHTVLLVDADVANPSLMKVTHLPDSKGLLDLLSEENMDVSDVLLRTNIEKLSILPAGKFHSHATEILASASMERLVDEMSTRYSDRILVFDSPPLLPTTEARALAAHMGQIVLVVEADRTSRSDLTEALETLENCPVVLMALNKTAKVDPEKYYTYGGAYATAD